MADAIEEPVDLVVAKCVPCSSALSSAAIEKSALVQPICLSSSSIDDNVPEPGLPILKRLPLKSANVVTPASLRANTVNGSGCTEKTARRSR